MYVIDRQKSGGMTGQLTKESDLAQFEQLDKMAE